MNGPQTWVVPNKFFLQCDFASQLQFNSFTLSIIFPAVELTIWQGKDSYLEDLIEKF